MSSALAIAAVTASLKDLLNNGLMDHDLSTLGSFSVTAQPPDRVTTGTTENNQLNLFLYQVTANPGWRNVDLPSRDRGGLRTATPPLALDLHYLLTAYGAQDLNAEVLLGYAMQVLHDSPVLTRGQLRSALAAPAPVDGTLLPGPFGALSAEDLADQVEMIKVTPVYLGSEDLSKLWTAMQARYRPSMAYAVSVVLIQSEAGGRAALPVLKRGAEDRGPIARGAPAPVLASVTVAANPRQPALRLGDALRLQGTQLGGGSLAIEFAHARLPLVRTLPPTTATASELGALLPDDTAAVADWAVGVYGVSLRISEPNRPEWTTNTVAVAVAPRIAVSPLTHAAGDLHLEVTCTPRLHPAQLARTRLLFGTDTLRAETVATPADPALPTTLTFDIPAVAAGAYVVRLRVDGVDSLPIVMAGTPPTASFDPAQTVVVT